MMKRFFGVGLPFLFLLAFAFTFPQSVLNAQNVLWANGYTASNSNVSVNNIRTINNGDNFTVGGFSSTLDFDASAAYDTVNAGFLSGSSSSIAAYISKTDNAGSHVWVKSLLPYTQYGVCEIFDLDMDASANIYVIGKFVETIDFDPGMGIDSANTSGNKGCFILKLDPAGNFVWVKTYLELSSKMWDIRIDENDGILISGSFSDTLDFDPGPGVYNMVAWYYNAAYLLKLNTNGDFVWAHTWDNALSNYLIPSLETDTLNNIYFSGVIHPSYMDLDPGPGTAIDTGNSFVVKLDPSGNYLWGKACYEQHAMVQAVGSTDVYFLGESLNNNYSMRLSEYDFAGNLQWTKMLENPLNPIQLYAGVPHAFTRDHSGNLYMGGISGSSYFLYATDSMGNTQWTKKSQPANQLENLILKVSPSDELLVAGRFTHVFDVDFGGGIDTLGQANQYTYFLMKYHYCGNTFNMTYNACDSVVLADTTYLQAAEYVNEFLDINGCDSTVFIDVNINKVIDTLITACDSVVFFGQVYTQSGVYTQIVTPNVPGCDSVATLHVHINTPAAQPAFMQLIQTVPSALIHPKAFSSCIDVDSAYNMFIGGIYHLYIPQLNVVPDIGLSARIDSSGNLIWKHAVADVSITVLTPSICLDDNVNLHTSSSKINGNSYTGLVEVTPFNNAIDDTSYFFGMQPPSIVYNKILNDPTSDKMIYIGYEATAAPNNPKAVKVKRGNNSLTFGSAVNAFGAGDCYGTSGTVDAQGNIYVSGRWQDPPLGAGPGQSGHYYCFIAKLDSNLNLIWNRLLAERVGSPKMEFTNIQFENNSLLACGNLYADVDMDYTANFYNVNIVDGTAFVARFDTAANIVWATNFGTLGNVSANSITSDNDHNIYVAGGFDNKVDLQPGPGISYFERFCAGALWKGRYVSKFAPTGTFVKAMGMNGGVSEIKFKSPDRIYCAGGLVEVYTLDNDTTVYTYPVICMGDSVVVGDSVYTQTGTYTNVFLSYLNTDSIVITNLTVNALPVVVANATDSVLCLGDSLSLTGSGAQTYTWTNGVIDNVIFLPGATATYLVNGIDINGCVNTDSIEIVVNALPVVFANASDSTLCLGDSVILFGTGAQTYTWNNAVVDSVTFAPLATSFFTVYGTDTNGCVNTDSIEIVVNALPVVFANASDSTLCLGDSVILFGTGAQTYTWNNGITDNTAFLTLVNGTYWVNGTDTNGCMQSDSITLTINPLPIVTANASDSSVCIGNPVVLYGTGADSFTWTNNVIDSVAFYPIDTAMYVMTGMDINGCMGYDSIEVITYQIPFPILVFSGDTLYCANVSGVNYYWFKDTLAVDSLVNYYVVTQNGTYQVLVVDSNGCVGADTISLVNLGTIAQSDDDLLQVYPNPSSGELMVIFTLWQSGAAHCTIFDLLGKPISMQQWTVTKPGLQKIKLSLDVLLRNEGIYFLQLNLNGRRQMVKFEYRK